MKAETHPSYQRGARIGETVESCGHNTRGKDRISIDKVFNKTIELIV